MRPGSVLIPFALTLFIPIHAGTTSGYVPGKYIVEISDARPLGGKRAYFSPHEELYTALRSRSIPFDVVSEFTHPGIFTGATVQLLEDENVRDITQIPGVVAIRPVVYISAPRGIRQFAVSDPSGPPPDQFPPHVMTGVDKVHGENYDGTGIVIAVIDSGIDYNHPALGAGFGPGHKVIGGYDFVGDNYDSDGSTPVPDSDPSDCFGHGTFIAGVIGADPGNALNVIGVAYGSSLLAYRIFGCTGKTQEDVILQAMLAAEAAGADILTISLGEFSGWPESTMAVVANRIAQSGKVVTVSAGNDGGYGAWLSKSPATGLAVISVASVENTVIAFQAATISGVDHSPIPYASTIPLNIAGDLPIYCTSTDLTNTHDACDPLPDDTPNLSGYLVVIHRGACDVTAKLDHAAAKGAKAFLIYDDATRPISTIALGHYTLGALISLEDGKYLVSEFVKNSPLRISFPQTGAQFNVRNPESGLITDFSTYGPSFDMNLVPSIAAPGGNIISTFPVALGSFQLWSGTSFSAPFVAGAAALLMQAHGKSTDFALSMRSLLQSTATSVPRSSTDGDTLQTVAQQGAGLIQVYNAFVTKTIVTPGQLALNDTAFFQRQHTISIKNIGSSEARYTFKHVPAGTALTIQNDEAVPGPVPLTNKFAEAHFSQDAVSVPAGQSGTVQVTFDAPPGLDASTYPVYSGFIEISSSGGEKLKVTYLGVAASLRNKNILDRTNRFNPQITLPALLTPDGKVQQGQPSYTLTGTDRPQVLWRQTFGSPLVRIDLVRKDSPVTSGTPGPSNPGAARKRASFSWWWDNQAAASDPSSFRDVEIVGVVAEFDWMPRNTLSPTKYGTSAFSVRGKFATGAPVPDGEYRVLLRCLTVTGNPDREEDYDVWVSPAFTVAS